MNAKMKIFYLIFIATSLIACASTKPLNNVVAPDKVPGFIEYFESHKATINLKSGCDVPLVEVIVDEHYWKDRNNDGKFTEDEAWIRTVKEFEELPQVWEERVFVLPGVYHIRYSYPKKKEGIILESTSAQYIAAGETVNILLTCRY